MLLIPAEQADGPSYRVGFKNFEVITRYNRSVRYAMAVHDLATTIADRAEASAGNAASPREAGEATKLAARPSADGGAAR